MRTLARENNDVFFDIVKQDVDFEIIYLLSYASCPSINQAPLDA